MSVADYGLCGSSRRNSGGLKSHRGRTQAGMSEPLSADLAGPGQDPSVSSYSASGSGEGVVDEVRLWLEGVAGDLI